MDWYNCYKGGWKGEIVPDAFQHPAKYSRRLIARIYDHLIAEKLIQQGDKVIDPFGGVALGALDAMRLGLHWTGVELESKQNGSSPFWELGNANISLWNARYSTLPRWGTAHLLNGDSRKLAELIEGEAMAAMKSPPFSPKGHQMVGKHQCVRGDYTQRGAVPEMSFSEFNLANLAEGDFKVAISSPPYEGARIGDESGAANVGHAENYGSSDGQLGNMVGGNYSEAIGVRETISSPPYADSRINSGNVGNAIKRQWGKGKSLSAGHPDGYSQDQDNLGNIKEGDYAAAVSSPPYEGIAAGAGGLNTKPSRNGQQGGRNPNSPSQNSDQHYGISDGQLSHESGDTFWLAAREIIEQVHAVLAPNGVSVWVCKDFVRNKSIVPFCAQWRELCEVIGFETLYVVRAWMVEEHGTQLAHDGNHKRYRKQRKSFFRRLHESKYPDTAIDYEQIIFMRKS